MGISDGLDDAVLTVGPYCWEMFRIILRFSFVEERERRVSYHDMVIPIPHWECGTASPEVTGRLPMEWKLRACLSHVI